MKHDKLVLQFFLTLGIVFLFLSTTANSSLTYAFIENKNYNQPIILADARTNWSWSDINLISSESDINAEASDIAVDSTGSIHIVWNDGSDYDSSGADNDIFYKKWDAVTKNWSSTIVLTTESTGNTFTPRIEVDKFDNIHVIGCDTTNYGVSGSDQDVFYMQCTAANSSWSDWHLVSSESTQNSDSPSMCVDSFGNVHIVWTDLTNVNGNGADADIFYKKWNATTESISSVEVISTESSASSSYADIDVDQKGNLHVIWQDEQDRTDDDIFYRRWNSTSELWQSTEKLTVGTGFANQRPDIEVDKEGNIHTIWLGKDVATHYIENVFYRSYSIDHSVWSSTEIFVAEGTSAESINSPKFTIDDVGNKYLVWIWNYGANDYNLMFRIWDQYTSTWSSEQIISIAESTKLSSWAKIALDKLGHIHITWSEYGDFFGSGAPQDIYYRKFSGPPETPKLAPIIPLIIETSTITLEWDSSYGATIYYVYRSTTPILSTDGLAPIDSTTDTFYIDSLPAEDIYFYVIVAGNYAGNSSISNSAYVQYEIPHLREITIATSLLVSTAIISFFIFRKRRKQ